MYVCMYVCIGRTSGVFPSRQSQLLFRESMSRQAFPSPQPPAVTCFLGVPSSRKCGLLQSGEFVPLLRHRNRGPEPGVRHRRGGTSPGRPRVSLPKKPWEPAHPFWYYATPACGRASVTRQMILLIPRPRDDSTATTSTKEPRHRRSPHRAPTLRFRRRMVCQPCDLRLFRSVFYRVLWVV